MSIYELYGKQSELLEQTEEARAWLYDLVSRICDGDLLPEQIKRLDEGGFRVVDKPTSRPKSTTENHKPRGERIKIDR